MGRKFETLVQVIASVNAGYFIAVYGAVGYIFFVIFLLNGERHGYWLGREWRSILNLLGVALLILLQIGTSVKLAFTTSAKKTSEEKWKAAAFWIAAHALFLAREICTYIAGDAIGWNMDFYVNVWVIVFDVYLVVCILIVSVYSRRHWLEREVVATTLKDQDDSFDVNLVATLADELKPKTNCDDQKETSIKA